MQTDWSYTDSDPAGPNTIYSTSPGPDLPTDATPRTLAVLGRPSPRRGDPSCFRRTFEVQGLGGHVLTSTRSFVSR